MANSRAGNVIRCDTTATTYLDATQIDYILYIPGTGSPAASIQADDSSGKYLWEVTGSSRLAEQIQIRASTGVYVVLAGTGTALYIYLRAR